MTLAANDFSARERLAVVFSDAEASSARKFDNESFFFFFLKFGGTNI